jgi:hypothetical protein
MKASTGTMKRIPLDELQDRNHVNSFRDDLPSRDSTSPSIINFTKAYSTMPVSKKRKLGSPNTKVEKTQVELASPFQSPKPTNKRPAFENTADTDDSDDEQDSLSLPQLVTSIKSLLNPYIWLHPSCASARPLQIIHVSLSSPSLTVRSLLNLLADAQQPLEVLKQRQVAVYNKLEGTKETLQSAGLESLIQDAQVKIKKTETDMKELRDVIKHCELLVTR